MNDAALIASWSQNATLWTRAVREGQIASRREATDAAILAAVRVAAPQNLMDVGCGEGWLCRALADTGAAITGIDASLELVARAEAAGGGDFRCLTYAALTDDPALCPAFDVAVCNFSLLDADAALLLAALARRADPDATLLIQTVHPLVAGLPYADGWRTERFEAFGGEGWTAMPWYFRTLASWVALVSEAWTIAALAEPRGAGAGAGAELPASLLITAKPITKNPG